MAGTGNPTGLRSIRQVLPGTPQIQLDFIYDLLHTTLGMCQRHGLRLNRSRDRNELRGVLARLFNMKPS